MIVTVIAASAAAETPASAKKTAAAKSTVPAEKSAVKWYDSYKTAVEMAKFENKPLLVDFNAKWCGWCDKMDKEVLSHKDITSKLQKFVCVKIDIDKDRRTAYGYGVTSLPRIIVVNTHSEIVGDWLGYHGRDDFSKLLDGVVEYLNQKTGALEAPKVSASDDKAAVAVKKVSLDLSSIDVVIEQLASKDPAVRKAVITHLAAKPKQALSIAAAGLSSKYLGIRIASWELMKKIKRPEIDFDPWASTKQRNESLKRLKPADKPKDKSTLKSPDKAAKK